jgi:HSP20 family protein
MLPGYQFAWHPREVKSMTVSAPQRSRPARSAMEDLYDRMGRLMQDFLGDGTSPALGVAPTDIEETDDAYIVDLELPGVRREDVDVQLRDSQLRITGEIKERERKGLLRRRERRVGQFEHVVTLPGDVDPNSVDASLSGGVLTVRVGKAHKTQPRRIEVRDS